MYANAEFLRDGEPTDCLGCYFLLCIKICNSTMFDFIVVSIQLQVLSSTLASCLIYARAFVEYVCSRSMVLARPV